MAKCQDIGLGNPPTLREGKEVRPPHFFTSVHLHLPTLKFQYKVLPSILTFSMFLLSCIV